MKGKKILWGLFWIGLSCVHRYYSQSTIKNFIHNAQTVFVDVRVREQHQQEKPSHTINIPLAEIEKNIDFFKQQNTIVLFCNSGRQAGEALEILQKNGVHNVSNGVNWENIQAIRQGRVDLVKNMSFHPKDPDILSLINTEEVKQIAVALGKGVILKKHKTKVKTLANLFVLKGEIKFVLEGEPIFIKEYEVFEIPEDKLHEVIGVADENLFIVTQKKMRGE